jgi:amino acid adenylation domain-containing protein
MPDVKNANTFARRFASIEKRPDLIHRRVQHVALANPDRLAVRDDAQSLTFRALDARANALAHDLRASGVRPGVRVGLCHERGVGHVVGALATLKAGGAYVGLDPAYPEARLEHMLRDAGAPVLLAQRSVPPRVAASCAHLIHLDVESTGDRSDPPEELAAADDVAYVIYTSGSTGAPKGVEVSHDNLINLVEWHCDAFMLGSTDRTSMLASPAFDASVWELWPSLTAGASLHIPDVVTASSPETLRDWLVSEGITVSFVPTPLAEALLPLEWPSDVALRCLLTGGDVLHRRPVAGTPFTIVNNYGVTEATVVTTSGAVVPDDATAHVVPSIGRAIAGTSVYVLDADGKAVSPGESGELYIGGRGVAIGYINRPQETADRFLADPWSTGSRMYRTGDLVRVTAEGEVYFLGRLDNQVQIRGHRVELDEIATVLGTHPAVDQCAVVVVDEESGARRIAAYVVSSGDAAGREELREFLSKRLPVYMLPTAFVDIDALPLTSNGKLDRAALPAPPRADARRPAPSEAPVVEAAVVGMLEELLDLDYVRPEDNFFELGGHSLMGAQLVARVHDRFDVELTLLTIFDNPTAAGIAACIEQESSARR